MARQAGRMRFCFKVFMEFSSSGRDYGLIISVWIFKNLVWDGAGKNEVT